MFGLKTPCGNELKISGGKKKKHFNRALLHLTGVRVGTQKLSGKCTLALARDSDPQNASNADKLLLIASELVRHMEITQGVSHVSGSLTILSAS